MRENYRTFAGPCAKSCAGIHEEILHANFSERLLASEQQPPGLVSECKQEQKRVGTRTFLCIGIGHGCFGVLLFLDMDALVTVCSRNMHVILVWAWLL